MRLSRTGWNNVIIFSVMSIIIFLNFTNDKLFRRDKSGSYTQDITIFGDHAVILSLTINDHITIARRGKNWQITPLITHINSQALTQMMQSWQRVTGTTATLKYDLSKQKAIKATVLIAGAEQPYQLSLFPIQDQLLLLNQKTAQWFSLPLAIYYQLLPTEIINQE